MEIYIILYFLLFRLYVWCTMYVEFYFCVRYMWESRCVLYPILPILLDHPIQIQFNSFNFFIFFWGGGGPLFSFDNFLCNFCRSKCWFIGGFWRVRKGSKMSYRLNFNLWYYMYPKTSILTIHFYFSLLFYYLRL